jgi:hypothetical protein
LTVTVSPPTAREAPWEIVQKGWLWEPGPEPEQFEALWSTQ